MESASEGAWHREGADRFINIPFLPAGLGVQAGHSGPEKGAAWPGCKVRSWPCPHRLPTAGGTDDGGRLGLLRLNPRNVGMLCFCFHCLKVFSNFLISFVISSLIHWLFRGVLINFHVVIVPVVFLLLVFTFIPFWKRRYFGELPVYDFQI